MTGLALSVVLQVTLLGSTPQGYSEAYRESVTTGRPLVLLIGAQWCPGCRRMKDSVLPAVAKAGGLKGVAVGYVDADRHRAVAVKLLKGNTIPQLIRIERTPSGWDVSRLTGAHPVREVQLFIQGKEASPSDPAAAVGDAVAEDKAVQEE